MGKLAMECDSCLAPCNLKTNTDRTETLLPKNFLNWVNIGFTVFLADLCFSYCNCASLFLAVEGNPTGGLHLAVYNQEVSNWATLEGSCPHLDSCSFRYLACRYLNTLPKAEIIMDRYPDLRSAVNAMETHKAFGALYFSENFTDAYVARLVLESEADQETLDQSELKVLLDKSNDKDGPKLKRILEETYTHFASDLFIACGHSTQEEDTKRKLKDIPIRFNETIPVRN